jgi:predicted transcriptional regulator
MEDKMEEKEQVEEIRGKSIFRTRPDLSIERLVKTYHALKSARRVAAAVGIDHKTVTKYLREAGEKINDVGWSFVHDMDIHGTPRRSTSPFAKWLRANPNVKLPRSYSKAAKLSGISADTIRRYITTHHHSLQYFVRRYLGDRKLIEMGINMKAFSPDGFEYMFNTRFLNSYKITVDKWTGEIFITGVAKTVEGLVKITYLPVRKTDLIEIVTP